MVVFIEKRTIAVRDTDYEPKVGFNYLIINNIAI